MKANGVHNYIKVMVLIAYIIMITANVLANALPINGMTTGQVSDFYPNLFAPTGLTFSIWGLIYLLLACYTFYQFGFFHKNSTSSEEKDTIRNKIGLYFSISSIANAAWIVCWHYQIIPISMLLMLVLLFCLITIVLSIKKMPLDLTESFFIRIPFSVYFGWITVATIANTTILLVSLNWNGLGISAAVWAAVIIAIGLVIGVITAIRNLDIAYALVILWAYAGIFIKHTSATGFAGAYPLVINTVIVAMIVICLAIGWIALQIFQQNKATAIK